MVKSFALQIFLTSLLISQWVNCFKTSSSCVCGKRNLFISRVVNGHNIAKGAHPWQAAIYTKYDSFICGGTLITAKHILTAGHCIRFSVTAGWYTIIGMRDQIARDGFRYEIVSWVLHEEYFHYKAVANNDIAIGTIDSEIIFDENILPICLSNIEVNPLKEETAITAGWGTLSYHGIRPQILQEGEVVLYTDEQCNETIIGIVYNPQIMLCTSAFPVDACLGDSGGPLMHLSLSGQVTQIGVVSFGVNCSEPSSAGVYTRISTFYDWIDKNTEDAITCEKSNEE